mmetsp:Transcript_19761/g.57358  ORF Transcript_19761/g.57358 Transcript_19761/m.57358 type:complete len:301 (-) Transcript_19761:365-1267(-)
MVLDDISFTLQYFRPKPLWTEFVSNKSCNAAQRRKNEFSCIHYRSGRLVLRYVHNRTILLQFDVKPGVDDGTHSVTQSGFCKSDELNRCIQEICTNVSTSTESLFSVLSVLLHSLQSLPSPTDTFPSLPILLPQRPILDVGLLLLRCAAVSRRSAAVCSPLPAGGVSHAIIPLTDGIYPESQPEFLTFFCSLPWTINATMTCDDTKRNELAFNLGLDMGYPSPHFVQRAKQHGTLTVYHGTNPENLWSILTYGLQSLSNTRLSKNGAIMGHGVYLTTSKKVALFFANSDSCTKVNEVVNF